MFDKIPQCIGNLTSLEELAIYHLQCHSSNGEMLHGGSSGDTVTALDWGAWYRIALGAAEGLRYLHADCKPRVVHRDIKSNNSLLDEEMEAHVGDFGLAKLIDFSNNSKTTSHQPPGMKLVFCNFPFRIR
jgi:serine/threonine protein kinase